MFDLVKPGGSLLLAEFTYPTIGVHTVFGTLEGWWKFEDFEKRMLGALLSPQVCFYRSIIMLLVYNK